MSSREEDRAFADYAKAIKLDPGNPGPHENRGLYFFCK
jgi:hypothetical protein